MISIHDPIHGAIEVTRPELKLIDSHAFQRLRNIKQLGFAELAFPGATHTRYAHSLGAMHMATQIFTAIRSELALPEAEEARIRQTLRLAVLFHDLGHPALSHVSESIMPQLSELNLGAWAKNDSRQANHEDYTLKIILHSHLYDLICEHVGDLGVKPEHIAMLISGDESVEPGVFTVNNTNLFLLLHRIDSGEMDADRMDYLRRDAYYCGVGYGQFDHLWLIQNITAIKKDDTLSLGLKHKGVWAFENFLLARYHMFLAVYYHHTSVCFDHLLQKFYDSSKYTLPADIDEYLQTDDIQLINMLRHTDDFWAQQVTQRRPYRLLIETHEFAQKDEFAEMGNALNAAGIEYFTLKTQGILSKYFRKSHQHSPLLVIEPELQRVSPIEEYTSLYKRFEDVVGLCRYYCQPDQFNEANAILQQFLPRKA